MALDAFKTSGQLTNAEITFISNLSGLTYVRGDILYYNGTNLTNLGIGTANQVLAVNAGATAPEWQTNGGGGANTALSNLASVAINTTLVSDTDNTDALGTTAIAWSDLFLGSGAVITFNTSPSTPDVTITHSANTLTIAGGDLALGANNLTMTGSLGATGARVTKGWYTDVESTNMYTQGGNSLTTIFSPIAGSSSIVTVGTITSGAWNGTDIPVSAGGTGVGTITALSIWVANSANTITEITPGAGNSIRINGAGNAWEAFTPSASVPTTITVANEATDITCFIGFFTAATGDLGPKTNANLTFNSSTGVLTAGQTIVGAISGNAGTVTNGVYTTGAGSVYAVGSTGLAGGQTIAGSTLTNENLTLRANAADLTTGQINITSSKEATNTTTASVALAGGLAVAKRVYALDMTVTNAITGSVTGSAGSVAVGGITGLGTGVATALAVNVGSAGAFVAFNGALGTPSSGTLTNATGLPIAGLVASTSTALGVGSIELGHASDTSIARVSAGVVSIEGVNILTVAGGTLTGNITLGENTSIALDPAGSADGKYTGITISGTAGATLAFGDIIVLDVTASKWLLADANSAAAADGDARGLIGICVLAANDTQATTILLNGVIRADAKFPALTITAPVYLSETAGAIVVAQPTTTDVVIRTLGFALTADEIYFNPSPDYITHT